jgi:hypothetical protein
VRWSQVLGEYCGATEENQTDPKRRVDYPLDHRRISYP